MINWLGRRKRSEAESRSIAGWGIVCGVVLVTIIGAYNILGQAPQPAGGLKIGVVNMAEVFEKSNLRKQFTEALEKQKKEEEVKIKDIENQIRDLRKQIEVMDPESDLRMQKELDVKQLSLQLEDRVKRWNKRINTMVNEQTALLYNEMRDAIDKYAKQNGFTLVLKTDPLRLEKNSDESSTLRINIRSVIYYDPTIDLTEEIIKVLNK